MKLELKYIYECSKDGFKYECNTKGEALQHMEKDYRALQAMQKDYPGRVEFTKHTVDTHNPYFVEGCITAVIDGEHKLYNLHTEVTELWP